MEHHSQAIEKLIAEYENDERFLATIIGGSVAKGCARPDSDVDFMIVAEKSEFENRKSSGELFINRTDLCDYPGGFVDGKIVDLSYIEQVAERGNEPSRAAFDGAFIAYSHIEDLSKLLDMITVYPESNYQHRLKSFYSMAFIQNWLMGEAERHNNLYTKTRAASQLALFAGRLILTHNRVLFPYHKWFIEYIKRCEEKPLNFLQQIESLLISPNLANANALFENLRMYHDWQVTDHQAYLWFMTEVEQSWILGDTSLEDM